MAPKLTKGKPAGAKKSLDAEIRVMESATGEGAAEEKDDPLMDLINLGKEKGYLLYDDVNDLLPARNQSPAETSMISSPPFGTAGIEVIDTEEARSLAGEDGRDKKFDGEPPR